MEWCANDEVHLKQAKWDPISQILAFLLNVNSCSMVEHKTELSLYGDPATPHSDSNYMQDGWIRGCILKRVRAIF